MYLNLLFDSTFSLRLRLGSGIGDHHQTSAKSTICNVPLELFIRMANARLNNESIYLYLGFSSIKFH